MIHSREGFNTQKKSGIYHSFYLEGRERDGIIQRLTLGLAILPIYWVSSSVVTDLNVTRQSWRGWGFQCRSTDWPGSKFRHLTGCSGGSHRTRNVGDNGDSVSVLLLYKLLLTKNPDNLSSAESWESWMDPTPPTTTNTGRLGGKK